MDLPGSELQIPHPTLIVKKRSGHSEPFDTVKIARAIDRAAVQAESEGFEWAANLASGVALYLDSVSDETIDVEVIHRSIERVLLEMGHVRTALSLTRHQKQQHHSRSLVGTREQDGFYSDESVEDISIPKAKIHDFFMGRHSSFFENPEKTIDGLGRFLKQTYAESVLLPSEILHAHHSSKITIKGLDGPDKLSRAKFTLERLKKYGCTDAEHDLFQVPRKHEELSFQVARQIDYLASFVNEGLEISGLNYSFAPYILEFDAPAMEEVAKFLLDTLSTSKLSPTFPAITFGIQLEVPQELSGMEAIGPNGASTGKSYSEYRKTAEDFSIALLRVASKNERDFSLIWNVDLAGDDRWLDVLSEGIRSGLPIQLNTQTDVSYLPNMLAPWPFQETIVNQIHLHLPSIADSQDIFESLDHMLELAVRAHQVKFRFIAEILNQPTANPLSSLRYQHHGEAWLNLENGIYTVQVSGLSDCIGKILGQPIHETKVGQRWGVRLVRHLADACARHSETTGLQIRLETVRGDLPTSPGLGFSHEQSIPLRDRVAGENQFQPILGKQTIAFLPGFQAPDLATLLESGAEGRFQFV